MSAVVRRGGRRGKPVVKLGGFATALSSLRSPPCPPMAERKKQIRLLRQGYRKLPATLKFLYLTPASLHHPGSAYNREDYILVRKKRHLNACGDFHDICQQGNTDNYG